MSYVSKDSFRELLKDTPIICAIKSQEDLEKALTCESLIVFILFGDMLTIREIVSKVNSAKKLAFVHVDLIEGFSSRTVVVDYLVKNMPVSGIISTKPNIVRRAKEAGLFTVYRFFALDSMAFCNIIEQAHYHHADAIEILPGGMPKVIKKLSAITQKPVIASGLINDKEDVLSAINAGAMAISSTNNAVWVL
ncbi:MAG: glycerol-3-phosphate responsive antiterminator [Oscillospiraceae bacterium]|nr:glycerol-3-phosphate responsive antiterminator [Oscillospiraceae bacterium]